MGSSQSMGDLVHLTELDLIQSQIDLLRRQTDLLRRQIDLLRSQTDLLRRQTDHAERECTDIAWQEVKETRERVQQTKKELGEIVDSTKSKR